MFSSAKKADPVAEAEAAAEARDAAEYDLHIEELEDLLSPEQEVKEKEKKLKFAEPKKVKAKAPPPVEVVEPEPEPSKRAKILKAVKIYSLLVFWIICTIYIMVSEEDTSKPRYVAILKNETRYFMIPSPEQVNDYFSVSVAGPFVDAHDLVSDTVEGLKIRLQRVYYDDRNTIVREKVISKLWKIPTVEADGFDHVRIVEKNHLFELDRTDADGNIGVRLELFTNIPHDVNIKLWYDATPVNKHRGIIYGALVLGLLYILIVWEIVNRTFAAMFTSTLALSILAVMGNRPTLDTIMSWIDMETMLLLFGMMILVGILSDSGIFDFFAVYAYRLSKGYNWPLINCLCLFTASLSAFLDSVTMMLLISPIVIKLCEVTMLDPVWVLMFLIIFANIGAASTPVGDPPNIIITTNRYIARRGIHFGNFMMHTIPCIICVLIQTYIQLRIMFRGPNSLKFKSQDESTDKEVQHNVHMWERAARGITATSPDEKIVQDTLKRKANRLRRNLKEKLTNSRKPTENYDEILHELRSSYGIRNKVLLVKSSCAFIFVLAVFFLHSIKGLHHLSMGWTAIIGALLLLILADVRDLEAILRRIEWSTMLFFASLFILMETLQLMGLIDVVGRFVMTMVFSVEEQYRLMVALMIVLWVSAIASAFLDNIPVTAMMIRIVISLAENRDLKLPLHPLVWALAMGACFGGNGTLIAASANVVSAGVAEQHGYKFTFMRFFYVGFPLMIGNIIVTSIYLLVAHCYFEWHGPTPEEAPI